jgi:methylsterol monooxygenase
VLGLLGRPDAPERRYVGAARGLRTRLPTILLNFAFVELGVLFGFGLLQKHFLVETRRGFLYVAFELLVANVIDDFYQYWAHRAMHEWKPLFKRVHKFHHRVREPLPVDFLYVHPIESLIGSLGILFTLVVMRHIELRTFYIWSALKTLHVAALHSGIRGPFALLPFVTHPEHHERHHAGPGIRCNYAQGFTYLDRIFGTDDPASRRRSIVGLGLERALARLPCASCAPSLEKGER